MRALPRILANIRRRAAFHSEDEYRLNARKHLRVEGDAVEPPRVARRRGGTAVAPSG